MLSTHILSDVERICSDVAFLNNGVADMQGNLSDIKTQFGKDEYSLELQNENDALLIMDAFKCMRKAGASRLDFSESEHSLHDVLLLISDRKIRLIKVERMEPTLESLFMEMMKK